MRSAPPNILYLHSHDTGRYVQPYGHPVPTPNIQRLADQGVLFHDAFCAAPTCSASRACLLTGQYGHNNGMMGLAHRGWSLNDYRQHLVHPLHDAGYHTVLIGEQHVAKRPDVIGLRSRGQDRDDYGVHLAASLREGTTPNRVSGAKLMWSYFSDFLELMRGIPRFAGMGD